LKSILEKLGQDPQRSFALFLRGLGLFVLGLALVFIGRYQHYYWQILGLCFLVIACITAAWGYLGIFSNRLLNIFNHSKR